MIRVIHGFTAGSAQVEHFVTPLGEVATQLLFQIEAAVIRANGDNARAGRVTRFGGGNIRLFEANGDAAMFRFFARKLGDNCAARHHNFAAWGNGLKIPHG